ncbi:hypothetical protein [Rhodococcus sp. IEGM 1330]|uniref:hypothetical protein n=1 Tax=Rhodococcus sp. IEGM 1330 TaxID=3082225 RepID=UPI002954634F|nr:hypothetical protein [Rhodococcus sp. IEGM 1330]MDV8022300.1 hypothetical protein [Rhodococcus sp. IEGM 1330]
MTTNDSLSWIRDTYNVPAEIEQRVRFTGYSVPVEGRIIGAQSGHLHVLFDTEPGVVAMHPTWKVEYLGTAEVSR